MTTRRSSSRLPTVSGQLKPRASKLSIGKLRLHLARSPVHASIQNRFKQAWQLSKTGSNLSHLHTCAPVRWLLPALKFDLVAVSLGPVFRRRVRCGYARAMISTVRSLTDL